jgi:nucleotide-binding universal stress UspA family protein
VPDTGSESYRHILVATDGSSFSAPAVRAGVGLAKALGARLTGFTVLAPYSPASTFSALRGFSSAVLRERSRALAAFNAEARRQAVPATATHAVGGEPWRQILLAARQRKCDLIVMASHGRSGVKAALLGSEAAKVLTHSKIPVLVCR